MDKIDQLLNRWLQRTGGAIAVGVLTAFGLTGCGQLEQGLVLENPSVTAPPLLRSEAEQVVISVRVNAPLRLENKGNIAQLVGIAQTGCSCYGMSTADFILKKGERIQIPPQSSRDLFFVATSFEDSGTQGFRVALEVGEAGGNGVAPLSRELKADGTLKILPDLQLEPATIVVELPRGEEVPKPDTFTVTVERVTRGKLAKPAPPEFVMTPPLLMAGPCSQSGPAEEIAPGLWRTVWGTSVKLEPLSKQVRENGGKFRFSFEFPEVREEAPISLQNRRRDDSRLPFALEIVRDDPERRISGSLLLNRSRGIVVPSQIHFGKLPVGSEPRPRRIVLTAADETPFTVRAGESLPQFEVTVDSDEPAVQQWVTVTFHPDSTGDMERDLVLKTSHPDDPEIRVMLKAVVR